MDQPTKNGIIFTGKLGSSDPIYDHERNIPTENQYTKAKVDGNDSYYVVYKDPNYTDYPTNKPTKLSYKIIDSTSDVTLGFTARSTQGWNKTGITLFEHEFYNGTGRNFESSDNNITEKFPHGNQGVSSIIVMKGIQGLYTQEHYQGVHIIVDGEKEFGPGTKIESLGDLQDKVKSIKYIREYQ